MATYCDSPATLRLEALDGTGAVVESLDLMDDANGYLVASLDVAFPTVRESVAVRPTRDGDYDVTYLYGPRPVTITGSFVPSSAGSRQKAMQALAWWAQPSLQPRLVYAYDADCPPQFLRLRGSALSAPASNPWVSAFTVSWVAPDPIAKALNQSQTTAIMGTDGTVTNNGTYRAWPVLHIYGPCTDPDITFSPGVGQVAITGYTIAAGDYLEVDTNAQTCLLNGVNDTAHDLYQYIDFTNTTWAACEPGSTDVNFWATGVGTGAKVDVMWWDSFI